MSHTIQNKKTSQTLPLERDHEHVLFVDDDKTLAEMGKRILELHDYQVTIKTSGIDTLNTFKSTPDKFDLVITDQSMPNMSGTELAAELLEIRPDIPIILCSGYSRKASIKKAKSVGIKEFCIKPLTINQLVNTVRKVLNGK